MTDAPGPGWRADVRERVAAILTAQVPEVQGRVYRARTYPTQTADKPGLLVYGYFEQKQPIGDGGGFQHHFSVTSLLVIQVKTEGPGTKAADNEELVERICRRVEQAVLRAPELWSPSDGVVERCTGVKTQISAQQREDATEVEATIEFQLVWSEIFTMAEPDTSCCGEVTLAFQAPAIS